jgi:hypothetical protein
MTKVLIVALGQMRGASITLDNFKRHLINELDADFAVCTTCDSHFDFANPFYQMAKYRWIAPHYNDFGIAFDKAAQIAGKGNNWRTALRAKGNWSGGIKESDQPGMGSLLIFLRWFLWENIRSLDLQNHYSHLIITRTDFMFLCPHPLIEQLGERAISIPNGEDYNGLTDRHIVIPMDKAAAALGIFETINSDPDSFVELLSKSSYCNIEAVLKVQLFYSGIISSVKRFPYIMYLARDAGDPSSWSQGEINNDAGHLVKYPTEYIYASFFSELIRSRADWKVFMSFIESFEWGKQSWLELLGRQDLDNYSIINQELAALVKMLMRTSMERDLAPRADNPIDLMSLICGLACYLAEPGTPAFFGSDRYGEFML